MPLAKLQAHLARTTQLLSGHTFEEITKKKPEKSLLAPLKKKSGRNQQGRITVRHRGGGHKRRYPHHRLETPRPHRPSKAASPRSSTTPTAALASP